MAKKKPKPRAKAPAPYYLALVMRFPLRPIRSDEELELASEMVDELVCKNLSPEEDDYLEVLSDLVEKYEQKAHAIQPASDAEMLRFLIEGRELSQAQLAADTGIATSTISRVLSGGCRLSRRNIGILARYFSVGPGVFNFD